MSFFENGAMRSYCLTAIVPVQTSRLMFPLEHHVLLRRQCHSIALLESDIMHTYANTLLHHEHRTNCRFTTSAIFDLCPKSRKGKCEMKRFSKLEVI